LIETGRKKGRRVGRGKTSEPYLIRMKGRDRILGNTRVDLEKGGTGLSIKRGKKPERSLGKIRGERSRHGRERGGLLSA